MRNRNTQNNDSVLVAAHDAPGSWRRMADYVCDGVDDWMEIQAASELAERRGARSVVLSPGKFDLVRTVVTSDTGNEQQSTV